MPLHVSSTCAHHQEVKIALHSLWYHHTETSEWSKITKIKNFTTICSYLCNCILVILDHLFQCDDTRGCGMQFWRPDDEHMCSKHVEAWNKLIVKQKFCTSSWLITEINIRRCTVSKTSKYIECITCNVQLNCLATTGFHDQIKGIEISSSG